MNNTDVLDYIERGLRRLDRDRHLGRPNPRGAYWTRSRIDSLFIDDELRAEFLDLADRAPGPYYGWKARELLASGTCVREVEDAVKSLRSRFFPEEVAAANEREEQRRLLEADKPPED